MSIAVSIKGKANAYHGRATLTVNSVVETCVLCLGDTGPLRGNSRSVLSPKRDGGSESEGQRKESRECDKELHWGEILGREKQEKDDTTKVFLSSLINREQKSWNTGGEHRYDSDSKRGGKRSININGVASPCAPKISRASPFA